MRPRTRARLSLAVSLVLIAVFTVPLLGTSKAAGHTYTWETCDEGWKIVSTSTAPTPKSAWHRDSPGSATSTMAMYNGPPYAGTDAQEVLTSPAHVWDGGEMAITFDAAYNYEPYPESAVVEEGIHVEWSKDGRNWTDVLWLGGTSTGYPTFIPKEVRFSPPAGYVQIRFRAISDALGELSGGAVDNVAVPADPSSSVSCDGGTPAPQPSPTKCTITGTSKGETLRGTGGADRICGKGGKDTLIGLGGKDLLNGGPGRDVCRGGPGRDTFKSCEKKRQ